MIFIIKRKNIMNITIILLIVMIIAIAVYNINIYRWLKKELKTFQEYIPQNELEYERQQVAIRILERILKKITH